MADASSLTSPHSATAPGAPVDTALEERILQLVGLLPDFTEIRYHHKRSRGVTMRRGELQEFSSRSSEGVGIRVLSGGCWGFAATDDLTRPGLERALRRAERNAKELAGRRKRRAGLAPARLARGIFEVPGYHELDGLELEARLDLVRRSEAALRGASPRIDSALCRYHEIFEEKFIASSDGAAAWLRLARPELRLTAYANRDGSYARGHESVGVTGAWDCLFLNRSAEEYTERAAADAVDLLRAKPAAGGRMRVILSPAMVGLLSHEAIGHTVEADFVRSGSVAAGRLGQMVASPLVTLCDSGASEYQPGAGGILPVDDEGVFASRTTLIQNGKLVGYLHNRESACEFETEPAGNARAWEFNDEPLIRMRNTYIQPGEDSLEDMLAGVEEGLFIDGPEGGEADATGEFMFGASRVRRIRKGKIGELVQKVTVTGTAFETLQSVDAVSRDFRWDLGAGHCGKGQLAKVDAGGPYMRCELLVGGAQDDEDVDQDLNDGGFQGSDLRAGGPAAA